MAISEHKNGHFEEIRGWLQILELVSNSTIFHLLFDTYDSPGAVFIWKWEKYRPYLLVWSGLSKRTSCLLQHDKHFSVFCTIPISVDVEFLLRLRDICSKFPFTKHIFIALSNNATMLIQLNKYETAPNFIQLSQNLILDCLLI